MPGSMVRAITRLQDADDATLSAQEKGDVLYFDGSKWVNLHHGTSGQFLKTQGDGADPAWSGLSATDLAPAVILAPGTGARNVIQPTGNFPGLTVQESLGQLDLAVRIEGTPGVLRGITGLGLLNAAYVAPSTTTGVFQANTSGGYAGFLLSGMGAGLYGFGLEFVKSRSADGTTPAIVHTNDELGRFDFYGDDGATVGWPGATAVVEVDGAPGANHIPGRIILKTSPGSSTLPVERLRITSGGLVGINKSIPGAMLGIKASADATIGAIIQRNSATQSGDLTEWQTSTGAVLASIGASGAGLIRPADAATTALTTALTLGHSSSGTPAGGFGTSLAFTLQSNTTADRLAARIDALWATATDASRQGRLSLSAWGIASAAETVQEGLRIQHVDGTEPIVRVMNNLGIGTDPSYRFHLGGTSKNTVFLGVSTGSAVDGDILYYALATNAGGAVSGGLTGFNVDGRCTGSFNNLFKASGATADSHCRFEMQTASSAGGDPKMVLTILGQVNWAFGLDNSDSDRFKISQTDDFQNGRERFGLTAAGIAILTAEDAATTTLTTTLTHKHNTTDAGGAGAGFGTSHVWQLESSTTEDRPAAQLDALWATATDASRKARLVLSAYDTLVREGLRIEASGTAPMIGFLGAAAVARPASTDDLRTALINLGLYTTGGASPLDLNGGAFTAGSATIGTLAGLLKGTAGAVGAASAGTDYGVHTVLGCWGATVASIGAGDAIMGNTWWPSDRAAGAVNQMPAAGNITALSIVSSADIGGVGDSVTCTLYLNGGASAVTGALTGGAGTETKVVITTGCPLAVSSGDTIAVYAQKAGAPASVYVNATVYGTLA